MMARQSRREAVLALFAECFDQLRQLVDRWLVAPDDEALHQVRIGLRRFRVLLRVFEEETDAHGGRTLRNAMSRIGDKLGAVRDFDVAMALLAKSKIRADGQQPSTRPILDAMQRDKDRHFQAAWRLMNGADWQKTLNVGRRFQARLTADLRGFRDETIGQFLEREFNRHRRRIRRAAGKAKATDPETLHAFRILLRRMRYLGDLLGPIADRKQQKTFQLVHAGERTLGKVHDIDMALAFLATHSRLVPAALVIELHKARKRRLIQFRKKWTRCRGRLED